MNRNRGGANVETNNDGAYAGANDYLPLQLNGAPRLEHNTSRTIESVVRGFKIGVTRWFRANTDIHVVWQRNYYEHIIRNENTYQH